MKRPNSARHESPSGSLPGQRVQHHVHTLVVGQIPYRLSEITAAGVNHVFHPEPFDQGAFARAAGAGDDVRSKV